MSEISEDPFADLPPSITIPLTRPVTFDGKEYRELVVREPRQSEVTRARGQLKIGGMQGAANYETHLVAMCADVPVPVIEMAGASRVAWAITFINSFLAAGPVTLES